MDPVLIGLRLLHVLLGVFWAGTIFFFASFMFPALNDLGPDGGKVMGALQKRRYADVMPVIALVTILSGLLLYYRVSSGFDPAYMKSTHGMGFGIGGASAIVALAIGMIFIRPAADRAGHIMQSLPTTPAGPEKDKLMAEMQGLRQRMASASKIVSLLLFLTVILMGISRYL